MSPENCLNIHVFVYSSTLLLSGTENNANNGQACWQNEWDEADRNCKLTVFHWWMGVSVWATVFVVSSYRSPGKTSVFFHPKIPILYSPEMKLMMQVN